jgi:hypothetical protein
MKRQETSHRLLPLWILISCVAMSAASAAGPAPTLRVTYSPQSTDGEGDQNTATVLPGELAVVTITNTRENPESAHLQLGSREIPVKAILLDPVSRLEFLTVEQGQQLQPMPWNTEVGKNATAALRALEPEGPTPCHSTGWVKHVDGKVLPFALLNVDFSRGVPSPGTPIVDERGAVVGIVFQAAGTDNVGYVIPVEAIFRVRRDLAEGNALVRGWLGLALHTGVQIPQISRILENSPSAQAGIQVGGIIQSVGSRKIIDYADASNAFFYVVPGEPVTLILRRGEESLEITLTPSEPPTGI